MEIPCCGFTCPVEATLRLVGGKYKAVILWHLMDAGTLRYHELHRRIPRATDKMLAQQLRELERDGLLYSERTSGRFVTEDQAHILRLRDSLAGAVLREFLSRMEGLGCKREEILPLLRRELEGTGGHSGTNERKEGES